MNVIILAAGIGSRLKPFTHELPKSLFKLDEDKTILGRMVEMVKKNCDARVCIVTGFEHKMIENLFSQETLVYNPFYRVTNSVVSLWFAREYLNDDVIIINSDVVVEEKLFRELLKINDPAIVLMDSSKADNADYKIATYDDKVVMMSKELTVFSGEYAGITRLSKESALRLKDKIEIMVANEQIDEWYENALVHMVLNNNFVLNFFDIPQFRWTEVDTVDDWLSAKKICEDEKKQEWIRLS